MNLNKNRSKSENPEKRKNKTENSSEKNGKTKKKEKKTEKDKSTPEEKPSINDKKYKFLKEKSEKSEKDNQNDKDKELEIKTKYNKKRNQKKKFKISETIINNHTSIPRFQIIKIIKDVIDNTYNNKYKISSGASAILHVSTEHYLLGMFEDSNLCVIHDKRCTLYVKDLLLARKIRGEDAMYEGFKNYNKDILSKYGLNEKDDHYSRVMNEYTKKRSKVD